MKKVSRIWELLWDTSKLANMINMRIQKEEERKKEQKDYLKEL